MNFFVITYSHNVDERENQTKIIVFARLLIVSELALNIKIFFLAFSFLPV